MSLLNRHNLMVAKFASVEESRYTLRAINVTPDYTEATDGHQAVRVTTPKGIKAEDFPSIEGLNPVDEFEPFLLGRDHALNLVKMLGNKKTVFPILNNVAIGADTNKNGHAVLGLCANKDLGNGQVSRSQKCKGQFPQIDNVIPKESETPEMVCHFDPVLLGNMLLELAAMRDMKRAVEIKFYKRDGGYLVSFEVENGDTGQKATGVLMGMRK